MVNQPTRRQILQAGGAAAILAVTDPLANRLRAITQIDTAPQEPQDPLRTTALTIAAENTPLPGDDGSIESRIQAKERLLTAVGKYVALCQTTPEEDRPALFDRIYNDTQQGGGLTDPTVVNGLNQIYVNYDRIGDPIIDLVGNIGSYAGVVTSFGPSPLGVLGSLATAKTQSNMRNSTRQLILDDACTKVIIPALDRLSQDIEDLETRGKLQAAFTQATNIDFAADTVSLLPEGMQETFGVSEDILQRQGAITDEARARFEEAVHNDLKRQQDIIKENNARTGGPTALASTPQTETIEPANPPQIEKVPYDPNASDRAHSTVASIGYFSTVLASKFGSDDFGRGIAALSSAVVTGDSLMRAFDNGKISKVAVAAGALNLGLNLVGLLGDKSSSFEEQVFEAFEQLYDMLQVLNTKLDRLEAGQREIISHVVTGFADLKDEVRHNAAAVRADLDELRTELGLTYDLLRDNTQRRIAGEYEAVAELLKTEAADTDEAVPEQAIRRARETAYRAVVGTLDNSTHPAFEVEPMEWNTQKLPAAIRTLDRVDRGLSFIPTIIAGAHDILSPRETRPGVGRLEPHEIKPRSFPIEGPIESPEKVAAWTELFLISVQNFPQTTNAETARRTDRMETQIETLQEKLARAIDPDTVIADIEAAIVKTVERLANKIHREGQRLERGEDRRRRPSTLPFNSQYASTLQFEVTSTKRFERTQDPNVVIGFQHVADCIYERDHNMFIDHLTVGQVNQNILQKAQDTGMITMTPIGAELPSAGFTAQKMRIHFNHGTFKGKDFDGLHLFRFPDGHEKYGFDNALDQTKSNRRLLDDTVIDGPLGLLETLRLEILRHNREPQLELIEGIKQLVRDDTVLVPELLALSQALHFMSGVSEYYHSGDIAQATRVARARSAMPTSTEDLLGLIDEILDPANDPGLPITSGLGTTMTLSPYLSQRLQQEIGAPKGVFTIWDETERTPNKRVVFDSAKNNRRIDLGAPEEPPVVPERGRALDAFMTERFPAQPDEHGLHQLEAARLALIGYQTMQALDKGRPR